MDKTTLFNIVAVIVAVAGPILVGQGFTGEVPAEWGFVVPFAISVINIILKRASKTETGKAMNI